MSITESSVGPADVRSSAAAALDAPQDVSAFSHVVLAGTLRLCDAMVIALTGGALYLFIVYPAIGYPGRGLAIAAGAALLAPLILGALKAYETIRLRRLASQTWRLALAWVLALGAATTVAFFVGLASDEARLWFLSWFVAASIALLAGRVATASWLSGLAKAGRLDRRAVIVGGGKPARDLIDAIAASKDPQIRILGVFDDRDPSRVEPVPGYPMLGTIDDLVAFARVRRVDLLIVALPLTAETRVLQLLKKLWVLPVDIRLAAQGSKLRFTRRSYSWIGDVPFLDVFDKPIRDWDVVLKAVFDRSVGALALLALSPIMLLAALLIKLDSRGPVLFRQKRHGFNNELIEVYKFRSMYTDRVDVAGALSVTREDPRVTRVGRFIRKTSIDELPQLLNVVFKGDMSLVGPRPHATHSKAADKLFQDVVDGYYARHKVKPGITGLAQLHGWRGETDTAEKLEKRVEYDLEYIENWSVWLDLYILSMTPVSLLTKRDGAY